MRVADVWRKWMKQDRILIGFCRTRIASLYSAISLACLQPRTVEGKSEHTEIIQFCAEDNDQRYFP